MAKKSSVTPAEPPSFDHVFGRTRPNASGTFSLHTTPKRDTHFRDLPPPTGKPPFQLDLKTVVPAAQYKAIVAAKKLVFHLNGDMGGINYDVPPVLRHQPIRVVAEAKAVERPVGIRPGR